MHRQAGDAQRGRTFQTVAQEGGEQESSRRLGGGLGFGFFRGAWGGACTAEKALSAARAST